MKHQNKTKKLIVIVILFLTSETLQNLAGSLVKNFRS